MSSLATELPAQIKRVWDIYESTYDTEATLRKLGEVAYSGRPLRTIMRASCDRAVDALASQDVVEMLCSYEDLKGYSA